MYLIIKRFFDLMFSLIGLIVFSWLFFIVLLLVVLSTRGNPFFIQKRLGKDEKEFNIIKFKTILNGQSNKILSLLRQTSLDELPQLLNVIKGDMSLVGPRPLLPEYLALYSLEQRKRHILLPGLTGLVQVSGGNHLTWQQRLALDVVYVEKRTFFLDLRILIETVFFAKFLKSNSQVSSEKFRGN